MLSQRIERLREIRSFPSLVKYLRDELDWPIETDNFDDLTFDYEPDELGIDAKTAVKIKEIKQLRPLSSKQPWGIFFINFEPKQLPIVVLRRILRSLVVRKRSDARKSQQAAWQLHDLLFISSYGESEHREITFAHFSEPTDRLFGDLPTLRVLGWDDDDTKLKIDHVVHTLSEKMRWPVNNEADTDAWRKKWSAAFILRPREVIKTSKELATRLADLAKSIRQRANLVLGIESERGPLRKLHKAFQTALIHDLNEDDFADMYAQTITYGLLTAIVSRPAGIVADNIADLVITNPFLKEMLSTFLSVGGRKGKIDFDELGIQEVVDLLNSPDTHMDAILLDFGKKTMQEDPVIHFYQDFLNEYDKAKRIQRGVFYTPQPVVKYIVRSVDELLKKEFGLEDGLASIETWGEMHKRNPEIKIPEGVPPDEPFVQILDIATGTATFLVEVIEVIYKTMTEKWLKEGHMALEIPKLWNKYVPKHLLPRLYGFELMMAPYAIAHMKIGLKLGETGYRFGSDERAHIYLTSSLEPPSDAAEQPQFEEMAPALAHEAEAVNSVKRMKRFTIVVGNPPYQGISSNRSTEIVDGKEIPNFIGKLLREYYFVDDQPLGERNPKWLQDDYVKFIRFGQWCIEKTGKGILAFITNHGYLDNPTFRGMRQHLLNTFSDISVLDLHGNAKKKEKCPDSSKDENVFDIQQGVAIGVFVKEEVRKVPARVHHANLWGLRELPDKKSGKYQYLFSHGSDNTKWTELSPQSPFYLFVPQDTNLKNEYEKGQKITDIMPVNGVGMTTARDHVVIDFETKPLLERATIFRDSTKSDSELCQELLIPEKKGWNIPNARRLIKKEKTLEQFIVPVQYRPFDTRFIFYHDSLVWRTVKQIMGHMLAGENIGLLWTRPMAPSYEFSIALTNSIIDQCVIGNKSAGAGISYLGPLYLYSDRKDNESAQKTILDLISHLDDLRQRPNLNAIFIADLEKRLNIKFNPHDVGDLKTTLGSKDIFNYIYSVFHSPTYRTRYGEFLKRDFPRLPLTSDLALFRTLVKKGARLVLLHLLEDPILNDTSLQPNYPVKGNDVVEKVSYEEPEEQISGKSEPVIRGWVYINKTQYFEGIEPEVWNFHIGGYRVCEKWLKDRKGRTLSADDINHYHRIVVALIETIRLMAEIDKVIEAHGGWPGAFQDEKAANAEYTFQPEPLLKAAEETAAYSPHGKVEVYSKSTPSLKGDWRTWLALSQWVKETMSINIFWGDFALEISNSLKAGKKLTDKQKEEMKKCWKQAVKKGFRP